MKRIACHLLLMLLPWALHAQEYQIDPQHTYVLWKASHFDFSFQSGKWPAEGTLILDENNPEKSEVKVTINMADLITGDPEFNKHLKDRGFLYVKKYPKATFVSEKVTKTGEKTGIIEGKLTLRGVTKPVKLVVTFNKKGVNPVNEKVTVGFSATTSIQRSDFGVVEYLPGIGDKVELDIQLEANKS